MDVVAAADRFPRPQLVVSRCLGFEPVRYNGQIIRDDFVQRLAAHCDVTVVCPEVEIGLGVPRPPVRLVRSARSGARPRLLQPDTGRDLTAVMDDFAGRFLHELGAADGFVLKGRSPSCGLGDAKVFAGVEDEEHLMRTAGAFASVVLDRCGSAALEDEARLHEDGPRERFLTLLFGLARLRAVESGGLGALQRFHARYESVLLAYDDRGRRQLDGLVEAAAARPTPAALASYRELFARALARPARAVGHINALQYALAPVADRFTPSDRRVYFERLNELRGGGVPMVETLWKLRAWALRFEPVSDATQAYLDPYPRALASA